MHHEADIETGSTAHDAHDARLDHPTTIVLIDPTSHDGELGLELLCADDVHVSVVVLLSGRASSALREYALAEQLAVADAGWIYLEQVANRIAGHTRVVETIVATGPDPVVELAYVATAANPAVARILMPPSVLRHDASAVDRLCNQLPTAVPVAVASLATSGR